MYVRFITPWWRLPRGVDCGLFGPAYSCARDLEVPALLRDSLWAEIDWFERHLPVPRRFAVKSRGRWREMIARAFALAALVDECGIPSRKVATSRPGTILYRDPWQIVAKPAESTPTTWH